MQTNPDDAFSCARAAVPAVVPNNVEASALSSRAIQLRWSVTYAPERELIDGFFVGYRSFVANSAAAAATTVATSGDAPGASTFTYKTIRLAPRADSEQQQQQHNGQHVSPVSSVSKPSGTVASQVLVSQVFEHTIDALERDTEYTVLIQCFNRKGAGPTSDPIVLKTLADGEYSSCHCANYVSHC